MDEKKGAEKKERVIGPHGGYQKLRSYQVAQIIYDETVIFCNRFIDRRSRTHDQMVQAARSGVRNLAEGSMASATSKKTEMNLTNVARSSLEELLGDYVSFLKQQRLRLWPKDCPEALAVRAKYKSDESGKSDASDPYSIGMLPAEAAANTMICLINQGSYLIGRLIRRQEELFLNDGGFTERLYRARMSRRKT